MQNVIQKDRYSAGVIWCSFAKYMPFEELASYFYSYATAILSLALKLCIFFKSFHCVLQISMLCPCNCFPLGLEY